MWISSSVWWETTGEFCVAGNITHVLVSSLGLSCEVNVGAERLQVGDLRLLSHGSDYRLGQGGGRAQVRTC